MGRGGCKTLDTENWLARTTAAAAIIQFSFSSPSINPLSLGRLLRGLVLSAATSVPSETLLVEPYHHLRAAYVGYACRHDVGLVAVLPLDQKHEFARRIGGADDAVRIQAPVEPTWLAVTLVLFLLLATRRVSVVFHLAGGLLRLGLLFPLLLELGDQTGAVEVLLGFPGVLAVAVAFPLEQVLDFALPHASIKYLLDDEFLGFGRGAVLVRSLLVGPLAGLFHWGTPGEMQRRAPCAG